MPPFLAFKISFIRVNQYLPVLFLFMLVSCAASKSTPLIEKKHSSDTAYLTAKGVGSMEKEARDHALAELSRIFESRVYSNTYDRMTSEIGQSGVETSDDYIESRIKIVSEVKLKGVEIEKTWKEDNLYYALASLDKAQARSNWKREIKNLNDEIEGKLAALQSVNSKLARFQALKKTTDLWIQSEVLLSRLNVLGSDSKIPSRHDMKSIFQEISSLKSKMLMYVNISGTHKNELKEKIYETLGESGFLLTKEPSKGIIVITGEMEVRPVNIENPELKYARAVVSVEIQDREAGVSVGEITENRRAAHLTYNEAANSAINKVLSSVSEKLLYLLGKKKDESLL